MAQKQPNSHFCGIPLTSPSEEERKKLQQCVLQARKEYSMKKGTPYIAIQQIFITKADNIKPSKLRVWYHKVLNTIMMSPIDKN